MHVTASGRFGALAATPVLAAAFVLLASASARADGADMTRAAARALGNQGVQAYAAHDYAGALDKLDRAYHSLPVPSLGLWSARALAQTGKLVAASERYLEVARLEVKGGDLAIQQQAKADAASDRAALMPRIPNLI